MRHLIFLHALFFLGLNHAFGCVCYDVEYEKMYKKYDYVLIGRPITNLHPDSAKVSLLNSEGEGYNLFFAVEKLIKGHIKQDIVIINQNGGSCSGVLRLGDKYLVFGYMKSYAPPPITSLSPIIEIDSITGKEEIVYVPHDNSSIVGDYVETLKGQYNVIYTGVCGIYSEKSRFYRQSRKWHKK